MSTLSLYVQPNKEKTDIVGFLLLEESAQIRSNFPSESMMGD